MPYVKLDSGILDSSLWVEDAEVRIVFITILAMCSPDGLCEATAPGIARRANLPIDAVRRALAVLEAPDPDSRTKDDGRRIERVDGGYYVLNYLRYREKDHSAASRMRALRAREKSGWNKRAEPQDTAADVAESRLANPTRSSLCKTTTTSSSTFRACFRAWRSERWPAV